jgi:hypothetical protein
VSSYLTGTITTSCHSVTPDLLMQLCLGIKVMLVLLLFLVEWIVLDRTYTL